MSVWCVGIFRRQPHSSPTGPPDPPNRPATRRRLPRRLAARPYGYQWVRSISGRVPGPLGLCIARWRIVVCTRSRVGDVLAAGPVSSGALPPRDHHTHDSAPQHRGAGGRPVPALRVNERVGRCAMPRASCRVPRAACRVPRVAGVRSDPASGSSLRVREPGSGDESEQRAGSPDTDFAGHAAQFSPAISALRRSGHSKYRSIDALTRLDLNMSEMKRLTSAEITALLTQRKLWTIQDGKLTRQLITAALLRNSSQLVHTYGGVRGHCQFA